MVMRVGGLASGMDIESIVKNLMKAERMPIDKLKQQKQTLEWQRDEYRKMNTLLLDFRTELTQMKLTSKYRSSSVTTSDESKVTATAASSASQASYSISSVAKLASAAYQVSSVSASTSTAVKIDPAQTLKSQNSNLATPITWSQGAVATQTVTGDGDATVSLKLTSAAGFAEKIKTAELGKMSVQVNGTAYKVVAGTPSAANEVTISGTGELTFGSSIATGASIKVDYITDQRVQTSTLSTDATTFQLDRKEINKANFTLNIGGTAYSADTAVQNDKGEWVSALKDSGGGTGRGTVNLTTGLVTFTGTAVPKGTVVTAAFQQDYADFSASSHTSAGEVTEKFLIQSSDSLNQVITKVNSSKAGVSMIFDSFSSKFSFTRTDTGDFNKGTTVNGGNEMAFGGDFSASLKLNGTEAGGSNAEFTVNGLKTERHSNTFEMSGVSITLKAEFNQDPDPVNHTDPPVSLSVSKDSSAIYDNIKGFIDKYNTLISAVSSKTAEERDRSYTPLTDDQREQLGDKQQEQWEEKAKSGMLRRDPILTGTLTSMRMNFSQPVANGETDAMYRQLASIGITTTANYLEGGKLEINEAKLKEAISKNPDAVEALFRGGGDSAASGEKGIVHRLYDTVNETMDRLKERAGNSFSTSQQFSLGRQLTGIDSSITRFEGRLGQIEDRYWKQFTAMEKAIQQANSQSSYLMQQFSM